MISMNGPALVAYLEAKAAALLDDYRYYMAIEANVALFGTPFGPFRSEVAGAWEPRGLQGVLE